MIHNQKNDPLALVSVVTAVFSWLIGGLGTVAFVLLLSPFAFCTWIVFLGGSVIAVMFGHQSRSQMRNSDEAQTGAGLAAIGRALGWAGVAVNGLLICAVVALAVTAVVLGPQIGDYFPWLVRGLEGFE